MKKNDEIRDFILQNYQTMTAEQIAKETGKTIGNIRNYLHRMGLQAYRYSKLNINHYYFRNMNANIAYILGFTTADGTVCNENGRMRLRYTLQLQDIEILEFIKNELAPNAKIKNYRDNEISLCMNSKYLVNDIYNFGIMPNKTGKEKLINIPKEYFYDYLRGLFDGDGTVGIYDKKNSNSKDYRVVIYCSNKQFLEELKIFEGNNLGNIFGYKQSNGNMFYCWKIGKMNEIIHLYNNFYCNNNFALKRKKHKMQEIVEYVNS